MIDLTQAIQKVSLPASVYETDTTGSYQDFQNTKPEMYASISGVSVSAASSIARVILEESDDSSSWTDMGGEKFPTIGGGSEFSHTVAITRTKAIVRARLDVTGTTSMNLIAVFIAESADPVAEPTIISSSRQVTISAGTYHYRIAVPIDKGVRIWAAQGSGFAIFDQSDVGLPLPVGLLSEIQTLDVYQSDLVNGTDLWIRTSESTKVNFLVS